MTQRAKSGHGTLELECVLVRLFPDAPGEEDQMSDSKRVRQLGDIRVTALDDGFADLPITVVVNIDEAGAAALAELSPGNDLLHPVFNAYLVATGGRRLLIDAGAGVHIGPNAGKMLENLAEAGVAPGDVDAIILTHCHPDHILGIVDGDWNAVLQRASFSMSTSPWHAKPASRPSSE
jgi:glyoxylase-like metal-dependent hydrolase (beta-lactamase superfamily II)